MSPARTRELLHLGRCLALARAFADLTQDEAAAGAGVSRKSVSLWETGVHEPGALDLLHLADLYGVGVEALCGRAPLPALTP